jgi:pyruvate/2-oxoglutarate dehydrogenase complex dihydrolipoamide acyltransferase (E2) component
MIKAAALSMKTVPTVNASWQEAHVQVYKDVDINIVTVMGKQ